MALLPCYSLASHLRPKSSFLLQGGRTLEPIITGCLAECGISDQACSTQCQVCVEKLECHKLEDEKCRGCRSEARKVRLSDSKRSNLGMDSGGTSLVHEGIRARLEVGRLESLRHKRLLRQLQGGILKFQRQAEWAAQERLNQRKKLHDAKLVLKQADGEVDGWELRSARNLKATRSHERELQTELLKTEAELDEAKKRLRVARLRLKRAKSSDERVRALKRLEQAKLKARKVQRLAASRRRVLELVEEKLENEERDAKWLGRSSNKKRDAAKDAVDHAVTQLAAARGMERFSRERLEKAKLRYRKAAVTEEKINDEVTQLEADFKVTPLQQAPGPLQSVTGSREQETIEGGTRGTWHARSEKKGK